MSEISKGLIQKFKRNSKLGKSDSEQLQGELFDMLVEYGVSDEVVETLLEGPVELMMDTFSQFVVEAENGRSLFQQFLHSKRVHQNKNGLSGQKMVYLLNSFLSMQDSPPFFVEKALLALMSYSKKNNTEEYNRKVVDLVKNFFMTGDNSLLTKINLGFINNIKMWVKVRDFMMFCAFSNNKATATLKQKIYTWLNCSGFDMGRYTGDVVESLLKEPEKQEVVNSENNQQDAAKETDVALGKTNTNHENDGKETNVVLDKANTDSENNGKETNVAPDNANTNQEKSNVREADVELYVFLKNIVQCINKQFQSIVYLKQELDALSKRTNEYLKVIEEDKAKLTDRQNRILDLNSTVHQLTLDLEGQKKVDADLRNKIVELQKEVSDRTQFAATIAKNRQMQSQEGLNKLAASLRLDYGDFCDAKDLEMSVDLGENMRAQLESVFSILKKHGIKLD